MLATVPTTEETIQAFLEAEGNLPLAVEKVQTTKAKFLYTLSQNPELLKNSLHTLLLVNLAQTLPRLYNALLDSINNLEPAEAAKTYAQVANIIAHLTGPSSPNNAPTLNQFNLSSTNFQMTPEIQQALALLAPDSIPTTSNHTNGVIDQ